MSRSVHICAAAALSLGLAACGGALHRPPEPQAQPQHTPVKQAPTTRGERIVALAREQLGAPYHFGGATPDGFDCSGLVQYTYGRLGVATPRTAAQQHLAAQRIGDTDRKPGDLVFFRIDGRISHVGIFAGDGLFIHAPKSGRRVQIERLTHPWFSRHYIGAGRLLR